MSRYKAAAIHLSISMVIFTVLAYLVLFWWYPDYFYAIDGGWEGMRIIIGVDLVLGPTLTLIVFKSGKPGLKGDLTMIGIFQATCLLAGVYIVYSERPLFFIYYEDHFYSVSADTFTRYGRPIADPYEFAERTPAMVSVRLPDNPIEEADVRGILYRDGIPLWIYDKLFVPLDDDLTQVIEHGYPLDELRERDRDGNLAPWLRRHSGEADDYAFFPIHSRYRDAFIAIRKATGEVVDILEVRPPQFKVTEETLGAQSI